MHLRTKEISIYLCVMLLPLSIIPLVSTSDTSSIINESILSSKNPNLDSIYLTATSTDQSTSIELGHFESTVSSPTSLLGLNPTEMSSPTVSHVDSKSSDDNLVSGSDLSDPRTYEIDLNQLNVSFNKLPDTLVVLYNNAYYTYVKKAHVTNKKEVNKGENKRGTNMLLKLAAVFAFLWFITKIILLLGALAGVVFCIIYLPLIIEIYQELVDPFDEAEFKRKIDEQLKLWA